MGGTVRRNLSFLEVKELFKKLVIQSKTCRTVYTHYHIVFFQLSVLEKVVSIHQLQSSQTKSVDILHLKPTKMDCEAL